MFLLGISSSEGPDLGFEGKPHKTSLSSIDRHSMVQSDFIPSNYRGQWSLTHFIEDQLRLRKVKELGQVTQVLNPDHLIKN